MFSEVLLIEVCCTELFSSNQSGRHPSSSSLGQTEVLALLFRLEAVAVAAAAAVPEPRTFILFGVEEPHHGVVLAAALVLAEETGVCEERERLWFTRNFTPQPPDMKHFRFMPVMKSSEFKAFRLFYPISY